MDISDTLAPNSDQLDAIDLHHSGPRVFTVASVSKGPADQPVQVHLAEFPRPWRPGKSMRRVLADCWGKEASQWIGHRVRLWCDPKVSFGGQQVGGVRVLAVSHIDTAKSVPLIITRGKTAMYKVEPLAEDPAISAETLDALYSLFASKGIPEEAQLSGVRSVTGSRAATLDAITEQEAQQVIDALKGRPDA